MKKKYEFSKLILITIGAVAVFVTAFSMAVIWKTGDTSGLAYLIPAVFAAFATAHGFYSSKAKAENKIKLMNKHGIEITEQTIDDLYDTEGDSYERFDTDF